MTLGRSCSLLFTASAPLATNVPNVMVGLFQGGGFVFRIHSL